MTLKTPTSLTCAGLFLKIVSWLMIVMALGELKSTPDKGMVVFFELCGIGLFFVAWKMQNKLEEWARLTCWGFALFFGAYFILDYMSQAFAHYRLTNPPRVELILGVCFIWLFVYLSQPRIKRLFHLKLIRT